MTPTAPKQENQEMQVLDPATGEVQVVTKSPLPSAQEYGVEARVSDLFPGPEAWAEFPQINIDEIVDLDLILHDVMIFDSRDYEGKKWAILLLQDPITKNWMTTAKGGEVLIPKLEKLKSGTKRDGTPGLFPVVARIVSRESKTRGHEPYYDVV